jgi:hypothetical protein
VQRSRSVAAGALAFAIADLLVGFAAFSSIALVTLWVFSLGWIRLQSEYTARGLVFGTPLQLGVAFTGAVVALPLLGLTIYLATRALTLPRRVYYRVRGAIRPTPPHRRRTPHGLTRSTPALGRPNYVAGFWSGS